MIKTVTLACLLYMLGTPEVDRDKDEIIITLEDLSEWMKQDIENGTVDPRLGEIYIGHFDTLIKQVKEL